MSSEGVDTESGSTTSPAADGTTAGEDGPATTDSGGTTADDVERRAQLEMLAEENRQLREAYVSARQSPYRKTAQGLVVLGLVAGLGGLLLPDGRDVLFALAGTGLFGGLLTYYLTPEHFVTADVSENVYGTMAANEAAIAAELGLRDERIYLPTGDSRLARLFVPQRPETEPPSTLTAPLVSESSHRGLVLEATGTELLRSVRRTLEDDLARSPTELGDQLADGLVETLELARSAEVDVDADDGRATIAVAENEFGDLEQFDHPVASFFAVGFAVGLEQPVRLEVDADAGLLTCRWESENGTGSR
ncbi:hypothetical protein OB919_19070 [Halobacteria archaeon AArc-curdl1]|uniref:DUF7982 domain-containing protein n=1 Tax=Natronosalvus hydrolyticus TaxID=2979988 RepID=A0AAP2ZDN9_9EURY|nr:hypothetical protein [Halobacteria archaeon AArc-curdl1]